MVLMPRKALFSPVVAQGGFCACAVAYARKTTTEINKNRFTKTLAFTRGDYTALASERVPTSVP
jgi:hypothetical protein